MEAVELINPVFESGEILTCIFSSLSISKLNQLRGVNKNFQRWTSDCIIRLILKDPSMVLSDDLEKMRSIAELLIAKFSPTTALILISAIPRERQAPLVRAINNAAFRYPPKLPFLKAMTPLISMYEVCVIPYCADQELVQIYLNHGCAPITALRHLIECGSNKSFWSQVLSHCDYLLPESLKYHRKADSERDYRAERLAIKKWIEKKWHTNINMYQ
jgi:hypothetical protein